MRLYKVLYIEKSGLALFFLMIWLNFRLH